ncbi:Myosin light chain kinase family member 4 [Gracilariopsis chorda]|uniref:Myosin light chain kinase family member 4 n=1 Tax=Gracilariopsis chorda TaxID=448386 RepID=A0A2V3IJ75_9FLOR|nr:Myosin light chain kinase family member 4 [Gracilariopsis chorda]|eukprot:PXF42155.1 Myosin light chain kinase family member 4 [Gracilariopsis chorda]
MVGNFEAYYRYTEEVTASAKVEGWLVKEGRKLRQPIPRYLRLQGSQLSNHRSPSEPPTWTISVLDSGVGPGPRTNELLVHFPNRKMSFFAETADDFERWIIALKRAAASNFSIDNFYKMGEVIGIGVNGNVLKGWDRATNEEVAIKSIPYDGDMEEKDDEHAEYEIDIIKSLDHPHLVKTYDVFRSKNEKKIYIVMEYVAGGELFERIANDTGTLIKEADGIRMIRNVLSAVKYLHERGIVHGDIKAENILCVDEDVQLPIRVKLADFGLSKRISANGSCPYELVGSRYYLAPEIIQKRDYGKPVDMWTCGILVYSALSGMYPFEGDDILEYNDNTETKDLVFPETEWGLFDEAVKDFISKLLEKDPSKRLTVDEALKHPWVADEQVADAEPIMSRKVSEVEQDAPKSIFRRKRTRPEDILARMRLKEDNAA